MKRSRIGFVLRWRLAVLVCAAIAAMAAAAAPGAAQAAGAPQSGGSAAVQEAAARAAQVPPPPMPGSTPAVGAAPLEPSPIEHCIWYTGSDTHAREFVKGFPGSDYGGRLIGGPGAADCVDVFGRGTDNALWLDTASAGGWASLGGRLTSRPGITSGALPPAGEHSRVVVIRGADGAVWDREGPLASTILRPWRSLGGRVLAGSGPAAVNTGSTLYVLAVGTDRAVWVKRTTDGTHWTGWRSLGGRLSGDLGTASPAPGIGIVFARGTDNAAWYNQFAGSTTGISLGWHSLGGRLTSGVGGFGGRINEQPPTDTIVAVMGNDNRIWQRQGIWPVLGPWTKVF